MKSLETFRNVFQFCTILLEKKIMGKVETRHNFLKLLTFLNGFSNQESNHKESVNHLAMHSEVFLKIEMPTLKALAEDK